MVTSKNELKILEWDVNKQKHSFVCCFTSFLCETSRMDNRAYHHLWYVMAIYYLNRISNVYIPTEKMTWLSKIFGNKRPHRSYCSPQKPLQIKKHIWYNQYVDLKKTHALFYFWKLNGPYLLNLESPSPNDALCLNLLKLAQWFWMRRFSNFANVFSLFSPFVKRCGPSFEQTWNPIIQDCCVQGLVAIGTLVLEKEILKFRQFNFTIV